MSAARVARGFGAFVGACLIMVGALHNLLGLPSLQRAVARGDLPERLARPQMVNWVFSGAAMAVLGILVILASLELDRSRLARKVLATIGLFFLAVGVLAYAIEPRGSVLIFSVLGLLTAAPLLIHEGRASSGDNARS